MGTTNTLTTIVTERCKWRQGGCVGETDAGETDVKQTSWCTQSIELTLASLAFDGDHASSELARLSLQVSAELSGTPVTADMELIKSHGGVPLNAKSLVDSKHLPPFARAQDLKLAG